MKNGHLVIPTARDTNFGVGRPDTHSWPKSQISPLWNCYGKNFERHILSAFSDANPMIFDRTGFQNEKSSALICHRQAASKAALCRPFCAPKSNPLQQPVHLKILDQLHFQFYCGP
jgi:hypothetical protein